MAIKISPTIRLKLAQKHQVSEREVREVFADKPDYELLDLREEHASDPPTKWFIARTYGGRILKVCYIETEEDVVIRTVYPPDEEEIRIFAKYAAP